MKIYPLAIALLLSVSVVQCMEEDKKEAPDKFDGTLQELWDLPEVDCFGHDLNNHPENKAIANRLLAQKETTHTKIEYVKMEVMKEAVLKKLQIPWKDVISYTGEVDESRFFIGAQEKYIKYCFSQKKRLSPEDYCNILTPHQIKQHYIEDKVCPKTICRMICRPVRDELRKARTPEQMRAELIGVVDEYRVKEKEALAKSDGLWPIPKHAIQVDFCQDGVKETEDGLKLQTSEEFISRFDDDRIADLYTIYQENRSQKKKKKPEPQKVILFQSMEEYES